MTDVPNASIETGPLPVRSLSATHCSAVVQQRPPTLRLMCGAGTNTPLRGIAGTQHSRPAAVDRRRERARTGGDSRDGWESDNSSSVEEAIYMFTCACATAQLIYDLRRLVVIGARAPGRAWAEHTKRQAHSFRASTALKMMVDCSGQPIGVLKFRKIR